MTRVRNYTVTCKLQEYSWVFFIGFIGPRQTSSRGRENNDAHQKAPRRNHQNRAPSRDANRGEPLPFGCRSFCHPLTTLRRQYHALGIRNCRNDFRLLAQALSDAKAPCNTPCTSARGKRRAKTAACTCFYLRKATFSLALSW